MSAIERLRECGQVGPLDHRFAVAMGRLAGTDDEAVLLGAALASAALATGDVGVDLMRAHARLTQGEVPVQLPEPAAWVERLRRCESLVRSPDEDRPAPLVLDGADLYLERTWVTQARLAGWVRARLAEPDRSVDVARMEAVLARLGFEDRRSELQKRAVVTAVRRNLALIAGGPGTGKTAVVVKLLALLQSLEGGTRPLRVRLAAPTGKAAARMSEAIRLRLDAWIPADLQAGLDVAATTIHRLLGWKGTNRFVHHADNPLAIDLLIVDEASMVDLPLMDRLLDAVPASARVVLLGDPDQLASVEMGSVFADLCAACRSPGVVGLTTLTHTWRFQAGIAELAVAVNAGDGPASLSLLDDPSRPDVQRLEPDRTNDGVRAQLEALVLDPYVRAARASSPTEALEALRSLRVLGAHRGGALGVDALNAHLEARVREALGVQPGIDWYAGRPVMVTRNDHELRLYNGDAGVVLGAPEAPDGLRVWFETARQGEPRAVPPVVLPEHETMFVSTVHKSQGSEYAHVVLVLPREVSPLVTRELLYTGVTRASDRVTVLAAADVWTAGVQARIERMSRLASMCSP